MTVFDERWFFPVALLVGTASLMLLDVLLYVASLPRANRRKALLDEACPWRWFR